MATGWAFDLCGLSTIIYQLSKIGRDCNRTTHYSNPPPITLPLKPRPKSHETTEFLREKSAEHAAHSWRADIGNVQRGPISTSVFRKKTTGSLGVLGSRLHEKNQRIFGWPSIGGTVWQFNLGNTAEASRSWWVVLVLPSWHDTLWWTYKKRVKMAM